MKTALLFSGLILIAFGSTGFISDSEFWSISLAKELFSPQTSHTSVYLRPLFYGLLHIPFWFSLDNLTHLLSVKILFATLGVCAFLLFARLPKKLIGGSSLPIFLILIFSTTLVFSQFYRVRSDILALMFLSLQLLCLTRVSKTGSDNWLAGIIFFYGLLAFCATPKAAIFLAANSLFIFHYFAAVRTWRQRLNLALMASFVPITLVMSVSEVLSVNSPYENVFFIFLRSYSWLAATEPTVMDEFFFRKALRENLIHVIAIGLSLTFLIRIWWQNQADPREKAVCATGIYIALLALLFSQRLPFFLALCIPYLCLAPTITFYRLKPATRSYLAVLFVGLVAINSFLFHTPFSWWTSFVPQLKKITTIEFFAKDLPKAKIFDGQGLLPRGPAMLTFITPLDPASLRHNFNVLLYQRPEIVIPTPRFLVATSRLQKVLFSNYTHIGGGAWLLNTFYENQLYQPEHEFWHYFGFEALADYH